MTTIPKLSWTPTDEQSAIADAARGKDSIMVNAYAGCAKSSTLQLVGAQIKVPALALAFNKKISKELETRFESNWSVKTINGLGHQAWVRSIANGKITLDEKKLGKLVSQVAASCKTRLSSEQWGDIRQLVTKAMQRGIVPDDVGEPLTPDTRENWQAIAESELSLGQDEFEFIYELAREVLSESNVLARRGIISFDDQVYCPVVLGGKWPQFPVVAVDEAQDLSELNHAMLGKVLRPDGRLVVVGDPKQSIYGFRGALTESMDKIRGLSGQWLNRPLTMTFRCPRVIVARQQTHAPGFRAGKANAEGRHIRLPVNGQGHYEAEAQAKPIWSISQFLALASSKASPVILCRNNGPLLSMAFKLLRRGVGCYMLGRDLGKGLERLSLDIAKEDAIPADKVAGLIRDWREKEISIALANHKDERVEGIEDRAESLLAVLGSAEVRDAGGLRLALRKLFSRDSGQIMLSSIHRAKGLEWDIVMHLDPWRIPSKWAKLAAKTGDTRQLAQEHNLKYVCETRTRNVLCEANLEDFE